MVSATPPVKTAISVSRKLRNFLTRVFSLRVTKFGSKVHLADTSASPRAAIMDTETVGIIGLFGLLFVAGTVLSLVFAVARKPLERFIDRIIPGGRLSGQISRGMRITVDPDAQALGGETFSVNLTSTPPAEI